MAQYDIENQIFVERKNNLFDTVIKVDKNGTPTSNPFESEIAKTAFNIPKVSQDVSIFSSKFTFDVSARVWEELDFTITDLSKYVFSVVYPTQFTLAESNNQILNLSSGTVANKGSGIRSKKHSIYQPGRGIVISTSVFCSDPEKNGIRNWGVSIVGSCIRFQIDGDGTNWELYALRKNRGEIESQEPLMQYLPDDFDISKPHLYQIQFSSIGDIRYFVDGNLIFTEENVNNIDNQTIPDVSLPIVLESLTKDGTELFLNVHSVDVSSEGGMVENKLFGAISTVDLVNASTTGTAVLALRVPRFVDYNGVQTYYSSGAVVNKITSFCRDESKMTIIYFRDTQAPNLSAMTWDSVTDSRLLRKSGGTGSELDDAYQLDKANGALVANEWSDLDSKDEIVSLDPNAQGLLNPGDILIVEITPMGGNKDSASSMYYGELR